MKNNLKKNCSNIKSNQTLSDLLYIHLSIISSFVIPSWLLFILS